MSKLQSYLAATAAFLFLVFTALVATQILLLLSPRGGGGGAEPPSRSDTKFTANELRHRIFPSLITTDDTDMDVCKAVASCTRRQLRHTRAVSPPPPLPPLDRVWSHAVIPFEIDGQFGGAHRLLFQQAMRHWENSTCIRFVERQPDQHPNYVYFTVLSCGCCSFVGRRGNGGQTISIGRNCDKFGIVVHELGHVIGFWHEHTRPDRDQFVTIRTENIITGQEFNFDKQREGDVNTLGVPYDYESIMHYAPNTFAKPFLDTIFPVQRGRHIGQRLRLSAGDIRRANRLYNCPVCGATFQSQTESFLASDSFSLAAATAATHQRCEWRIVTTHGENIALTIRNLSTAAAAASSNCSEEWLEVRDGYWAESPLLGRYCDQSQVPVTIKSTGNRMLLTARFAVAAAAVSRSPIGFAARYESICGGQLWHRGRLESPNYPATYPAGKECTWHIEVAVGFQVALKFQSFDLENQDKCSYDFVRISDGVSGIELGRFCGHNMPADLTSPSHRMVVHFVSDGTVQRTGFSATFVKEVDECALRLDGCEQRCANTLGSFRCLCNVGYELHSNQRTCENACGGQIEIGAGDVENNVITSPSFPDVYPKRKECVWLLTAPTNHRITINFTHFDVESDEGGGGGGGGRRHQQGCDFDSLTVYSLAAAAATPEPGRRKHGKFCGSTRPPRITSETNRMRLEFRSDETIQKSGFALVFSAEPNECAIGNGGCAHDCLKTLGSFRCSCRSGHELNADGRTCRVGVCNHRLIDARDGDTVQSPNYPLPYPANSDCVWLIRTTPGHRVQLEFSDFRLEPHPECANDVVDIYKGEAMNSFKLGRFCGELPMPTVVAAPSNAVFVSFRSDQSSQAVGFSATIRTKCGGRLSATGSVVRTLYSHVGYERGEQYGNNVECVWTIEAPVGQNVRVSFVAFDLESDADCVADFVEIEEREFDGIYFGRYCGETGTGTTMPPDVVSSKEAVELRFVTDGDFVRRGFVAEYVAVVESGGGGGGGEEVANKKTDELVASVVESTPFPGYV